MMHDSSSTTTDPAPVSVPLQDFIAETAEVLLRVPVSTVADQAQAGLGDQPDPAGTGRFEQKHRLCRHTSSIEQKENITKIQPTKRLIRETDALPKKRPIVIEVHSGYLAFRVKGMSSIRYAISIFSDVLVGEGIA
jgi:hypothetical protein